jgi:Domain of unknown function (DUF4288)
MIDGRRKIGSLMTDSWYSAKSIFRHAESEGRRQMFEERIVLLQAENFDAAFEKAELEARQYCLDINNCEFTESVDVFELFDENIEDQTEVFSSMHTSDLDTVNFLTSFYPETPEDCVAGGQTHRWYRIDELNEGCYHCKNVREVNESDVR